MYTCTTGLEGYSSNISPPSAVEERFIIDKVTSEVTEVLRIPRDMTSLISV